MARGVTLLETLVVMFILGIIASVALPDLSSSNSYKLDRAAEELAMGLRFARDESVRTGLPHAFSINGEDSAIEEKYIMVYKAHLADTLNATDLLYHPVSKQTFNYVFYEKMGGVKIVSSIRSFHFKKGATDSEYFVFFDKEGKPFRYDSPPFDYYNLYHSGKILIEYKGLEKSVVLEPGGWVSIQ
jgi:prepilin-type N-terminal cleavage/methylation domain-containing protein